MRALSLIVSLSFAVCFASAGESDAILLERAFQLETAVGNSQAAEAIYARLAQSGEGRRARGEAIFRLADLYARQDKNAEAKTLFLQMLRDFPEAADLIPLAELELTKVTALLTRDQLRTSVGSMHYIGDLAIALQGALENKEQERALSILQRISAVLEARGSGRDAPEMLTSLRVRTAEVTTALLDRAGGPEPALERLLKSKEFQPFLQRGFPSDPHDLFAPAWRMKDRLARAVATNDAGLTNEVAEDLERYLAPIAALPTGGPREGTLARTLTKATREVRALASERKFPEARVRLEEFDAERNEQFPEFRVIANLPMRMPEMLVGAAWVIHFRVDLARHDLNQRAYATAMDHVIEAAKVCREILPRVENTEAAALLKRQLTSLELALLEIQSDRTGDRLGAAQRHLRDVMQKVQ